MADDVQVYRKYLKDFEGLEEREVRAFVRGFNRSYTSRGRMTQAQRKLLDTIIRLARWPGHPNRTAILVLCMLPEIREAREVVEGLRKVSQPVKGWIPREQAVYTAIQDGWYTYANGGR